MSDTETLPRFDATERVVHWCTAVLGLALIATGAALYVGPISTLVGRRDLVKTVHVVTGIALPIPVLVALVLPRRGRRFRADVRVLNRFDDDDRRWLRRRTHAASRPGKFNAGQKLNAAFLAASGIVLLATGLMLRFPDPFSVGIRTGATFVHDWFAIAVGVAIAAHILFALRDHGARQGMVGGRVPARWARRTHPRWFEEVTGRPSEKLAPTKPPGRVGSPR